MLNTVMGHCCYARKFVIEWYTSRGSFTVESESIGMDNFVQKVF